MRRAIRLLICASIIALCIPSSASATRVVRVHCHQVDHWIEMTPQPARGHAQNAWDRVHYPTRFDLYRKHYALTKEPKSAPQGEHGPTNQAIYDLEYRSTLASVFCPAWVQLP